MKLIVGLGNPGLLYRKTRHNIGFRVLDSILKKYNLKFDGNKFNGIYCKTDINGENVMFLEPQKYINLSGEVLRQYIDYFNVDIDDILIIHDDLDMPVGKFKLKASGSSGGHNGLKNIELNLKTDQYKRLKIGISKNKDIDTKEYVLGKFDPVDEKTIDDIIDIAAKVVIDFINMDFTDLMNKYNRK